MASHGLSPARARLASHGAAASVSRSGAAAGAILRASGDAQQRAPSRLGPRRRATGTWVSPLSSVGRTSWQEGDRGAGSPQTGTGPGEEKTALQTATEQRRRPAGGADEGRYARKTVLKKDGTQERRDSRKTVLEEDGARGRRNSRRPGSARTAAAGPRPETYEKGEPDLKGAQKPKKVQKKVAQKTLKERRVEKRAASAEQDRASRAS
jgi:hypothetical protein